MAESLAVKAANKVRSASLLLPKAGVCGGCSAFLVILNASFGEPDSQRSIRPATSLLEEKSNPELPFNNKFSYSLLLSGSVSKSAVRRSNSDLWVKTS